MSRQSLQLICCLVATAMLYGCGGGHHPTGVSDTIANFQGDIQEPEPANLKRRSRALPIAGDSSGTLVETRWEHLKHQPCDMCHQPDSARPPKQAAHWDITLKHGATDVMNCQTCHDKAADMTALKTLGGTPVTFDTSYDLCGQCHFEQKRDWLGGSHGKRVEAWAGQRIIRNCTGCHNPHQPRFPKQMPAMAPGGINTRPGDGHQETP